MNSSIKKNNHHCINNTPAFSLVEMLMALLVASLLLAALAPVMTRRMADSEIKVMSEAANYDKDSVYTIITDSTEQQEFNIPSDANRITFTMMGGGGSGGNALYGNKEFTSSQNFTIPDNVNKIRVFMVGAGGGGASGGKDLKSVTVNGGRTDGNTYEDFRAVGETSFTMTDNQRTVPALDSKCIAYGVTQWTKGTTSDTSALATYVPNSTVQAKVTACGAGGAGGSGYHSGTGANYSGGDGGGGGSGGYVKDIQITIPKTINIKISDGGNSGKYGGGGCGRWGHLPAPGETDWSNHGQACYAGGTYGGAGGKKNTSDTTPGTAGENGTGTALSYGGNGGCGVWICAGNGGRGGIWGGGGGGGGNSGIGGSGMAAGGGGGGGPTTITTSSGTGGTILFQIGGGGGGSGGGGWHADKGYDSSGGGGGGGGYGGGGGAGGGGHKSYGTAGAGGASLSSTVGVNTGITGEVGYTGTGFNGGAGGAGYGGAKGNVKLGGTLTGIFDKTKYCSGGDGSAGSAGSSGKPGALRLYYTYPPLKCDYTDLANSGGGGGAGQIWIGEIDVTPKSTIKLNIGIGGSNTTGYSSNGNDGTSTSIVVNGNTYSVSGGKGGKYETDNTYISNSGGYGGGLKKDNFSSSARYLNWLGIDINDNNMGGKQGSQGNTVSNGAGGGNGGISYRMDGTILNGGNGGGAQSNGVDAISNNYGAGGGGGGGVVTYGANPGYGGKGANGYIYIEWGGTNGSGGTAGEIVQKVLTNFDGNDRKMIINIGKGGRSSVNNGKGEDTTITVKSGGKNVTLTARGGIKGNNGTSQTGIHGDIVNYPDNYNELYKEFIQSNLSIISGQKGNDEYGGMGGYLSCLYNTKDSEGNKVCTPVMKSNDSTDVSAGPIRPGCGGTSITAPLYESICIPYSTSANPNGGNGTFGGGGGGGAVLNKTGGIGGNGGDGFVILEYKSVQ